MSKKKSAQEEYLEVRKKTIEKLIELVEDNGGDMSCLFDYSACGDIIEELGKAIDKKTEENAGGSLLMENVTVMTMRKESKNDPESRDAEIGYIFIQFPKERNVLTGLMGCKEMRIPIYERFKFNKELDHAIEMADDNDIYIIYQKPPAKTDKEDLAARNQHELCFCIRKDGKFQVNG